MGKHILVLTGSPRAGGNSDRLAGAFIQGAMAAGHTVVCFDAGRKNILGCQACDTCFSQGAACSFEDDFRELAPLLEKAEALVLVSPLYWFGFSAQLKAALDKMYAFIVVGRPLPVKECLLLACAGTDDEKDFTGMLDSYRRIAAYQKWQDRGWLLVPKVFAKDDILNTDALEKAERLGRNF